MKFRMYATLKTSLVFSFFCFCQLASEEIFHDFNFEKAERLFKEELYSDACDAYLEHLDDLASSQEEKTFFVNLRIAECQLELHQSQLAKERLLSLKPSSPDHKCHLHYLLAIAYRQEHCYQEALDLLSPFLKDFSPALPLLNEIQLEAGLNHFHLNHYDVAKGLLSSLRLASETSNLYIMAQLYLIRLALQEQQPLQAQALLHHLETVSSAPSLFRCEIDYLKGRIAYALTNYIQAAEELEKALSPKHTKTEWRKDALFTLAQCNLKIVQHTTSTTAFNHRLMLTKPILQEFLALTSEEQTFLTLCEGFIHEVRRLNDFSAKQNVESFLQGSILSSEGKKQAELLRIWLQPTYVERHQAYETFIRKATPQTFTYAKAYYLNGMNDLEEAYLQLRKGPSEITSYYLTQAVQSFEKAREVFDQSLPSQAFAALNGQVLAYYHQSTVPALQLAWLQLEGFIQAYPSYLILEPYAEKLDKLMLQVAESLAKVDPSAQSQFARLASQIESYTDLPRQDRYLLTLGHLTFFARDYQQAERAFAKLINQPSSSLKSEALFWSAKCAESCHDLEKRSDYLQRLFSEDPKHPYAPYAYLHYYAYRDYMRGQRKAIKHLQAMPHHFPHHPLLVQAYYLIGLDHKKDHLSEEGKVQKHKNLMTAIEAFQQAESLFDRLFQQDALSQENRLILIPIRYRAQLERALANLAIAEESQGTKREIYLEYAEEVFRQIQSYFHEGHLAARELLQLESYPKALEESEFWLSQVCIKRGKTEEAEQVLCHMLDHYQTAQQSQGYWQAKAWIERGHLAQMKQQHEKALEDFLQAEKCAQHFSPDQQLDLWIQQSLCYKELHNLDEAMLLLSKVVNADVISSLRLKAMVLRADIYELQGRSELAFKQLVAASKQEGEWGKKAKDKLEKNYGYY